MKIFPAIDIKDKKCVRLVKGDFDNKTEYEMSPVEQANKYKDHGFKNLHIVDLDGALTGETVNLDIIQDIVSKFNLKVEVGGGIRNVTNMREMLLAGADKVSVNTAAILNPNIINDASKTFGNQCIVVAIDAKKSTDGWTVYTHGGRKATALNAIEWAEEVVSRGAGEILLTSMDMDGTKNGFDLDLTRAVSEAVEVPIIASGGVGNPTHMAEGITLGKASAVLAASIFHFGQCSIAETKREMKKHGIPVRL